LTAGRFVLLEAASNAARRTRFTLALVRLPRGYVSTDAHLPNALVESMLRQGTLPGFRGARIVQREPSMGRRRADFLVARGRRRCLVEVKSVTLVRDGVALFPDAPTVRGRVHLEHLMAARQRGIEAAVLFVIQRGDATAFAPNRGTDPAFAAALGRAVQVGVRVRAMTCRVTRCGVSLAGLVPVRLAARALAVGKIGPVPERG
jgi:sugar fermentation stimulation protein A